MPPEFRKVVVVAVFIKLMSFWGFVAGCVSFLFVSCLSLLFVLEFLLFSGPKIISDGFL